MLLLGTKVPGDESSRERRFQGMKVPGNELYLKFQGTKVPGNESSTYGTFVPGNESSRVRKFHESCLALVCLELGSLAFEAWLLLNL